MDDDRAALPRQFAAACEAVTAALGEWAQRVTNATTEAWGKIANDPAIRATIEAGRPSFIRVRRDCHCECAKAHPDDIGVCDNDAVLTRPLTADLAGPVDVPVCAPCATAQAVAELGR